MKTLKETQKMYSKIFGILNKYKKGICFDIDTLKEQSKLHLFKIELEEKYGLPIDNDIYSLNYIEVGNYQTIAWYGEKYNRTISYPNDNRQPNDELLYSISFPAGAYLFGDGAFSNDYPIDFFQRFWLELKDYKPDYVDEHNHCLYWKVENAGEIFKNFNSILKKYNDLNQIEKRKRQIEKLEGEISKLNSTK